MAVAFVYLMHDNRIIFHQQGQVTDAHGWWTHEATESGERFLTWFHGRGDIDVRERPQSPPTVLKRVTSAKAYCPNIFRAVSTAVLTTDANGSWFSVREVEGWRLAPWHILAHIVPK